MSKLTQQRYDSNLAFDELSQIVVGIIMADHEEIDRMELAKESDEVINAKVEEMASSLTGRITAAIQEKLNEQCDNTMRNVLPRFFAQTQAMSFSRFLQVEEMQGKMLGDTRRPLEIMKSALAKATADHKELRENQAIELAKETTAVS